MSSSNIFGFASRVMVMAIVISVILLFVGIGVLVLIHVCIVGRAFRRGMDSANLVEGRDQNSRRNYSTMSKDELEKLPVFEFKVADKGSSPVDCVVCLENFKMGDKCRLLPICKHSFHAECIDSWLIKTPICPICRTGAGAWKGSTVLGSGGRSSGMVRIELMENQSRNEIVSISSPLHNSPAEHVV